MRHGKKMYRTASRKQLRQTLSPRLIPNVKFRQNRLKRRETARYLAS